MPDISITVNAFTDMLEALERGHVAKHPGHHTAIKPATTPIRAFIPVL
ncbi:hypothetical protein KJZ71_01845 [Patescibacteria group bacterium]|nr:hypothetical protein [Patescibacteria group bacterium]